MRDDPFGFGRGLSAVKLGTLHMLITVEADPEIVMFTACWEAAAAAFLFLHLLSQTVKHSIPRRGVWSLTQHF